MTTVVYRDGIMAADTSTVAGDWLLPEKVTKIIKLVDGRLVGFSGNFNMLAGFLEWLCCPAEHLRPRPDFKDEASAIVVSACGKRVLKFQQAGHHQCNGPFVVLGSGLPSALGALHAGVDAREAVRIAALVDPWTGGEIESITLDAGVNDGPSDT